VGRLYSFSSTRRTFAEARDWRSVQRKVPGLVRNRERSVNTLMHIEKTHLRAERFTKRSARTKT
jgi:hypothetical protein